MKRRNSKWWLAIVVLVLLTPLLSAESDKVCEPTKIVKCNKDVKHVPEGGSAATYLLGAGVACFGAMFIRSRASKPRLS